MNPIRSISPRTPDGVNLIQITDLHVTAEPGARLAGMDTSASLDRVISAVNRVRPVPDAVLVTGDLVHEPGEAAYERCRRHLAGLCAPVLCLPGNHDSPEMMQAVLRDEGLGTDPVVDIGRWRLVLLNTWVPGSRGGRLAETELQRLRAALAADADHWCLVALHHPPVSIGSPWMDAMGLESPDGLLAVIDDSAAVRAVVWGHNHQVFQQRRGDTALFGTPSTCIQFLPGADHYREDERPPAYRHLWLDGRGGVESEVVWVAPDP